ncbi:4501_t:CDS:1, partial [Racocetra persica]
SSNAPHNTTDPTQPPTTTQHDCSQLISSNTLHNTTDFTQSPTTT